MRKADWHYGLDVAMGVLATLVAVSSLLLWVVFPRGYHAARALWVDIHKWAGLSLGVLALAHVALHWKWLMRMTKRYAGRLASRTDGQTDGTGGPSPEEHGLASRRAS